MRKLLLSITLISFVFMSNAQSDLIISEMVEGWSNNKALEIFNPTSSAIDLSGYRITRYSNGSDVPPAEDQWNVALPEFSLEAYKSYVVVLDKRDAGGEGQEAPVWKQLADRADVFLCPEYNISKAMYFNGDDGVALEKTDGTLVDLFARWGAPRPAEATVGGSNLVLRCWTNTAPHFDGNGVGITADHTMVKKASVNVGVVANPTIWNPLAAWDTLPANSFNNLGWHKSDASAANETPVFTESAFKFAVASDSENGTSVGTVLANDAESDAIKYFITYGNFVYIGAGDDAIRVEPFDLNKNTGELTVVDKAGLNPFIVDTFNIQIVATDGFSQTEEVLTQVLIDGNVSVSAQFVANVVSVWPNPVTNNNINISANANIVAVSVTNVIGQEVYAQVNMLVKNTSINIPEVPKGVYLLTIHMQDGSTNTKKIILR